MSANKNTERKVAEMSFEDALNELEGIVGRLERGDAPLEAVSYTHLTLPTKA